MSAAQKILYWLSEGIVTRPNFAKHITMKQKTEEPLVSIITPFLNTEKFFEECIESVIQQTYSHWELMLIDDGSTDNSTQIAKKYASLFPNKIHYLQHENHQNRGASASRNLGIQKSRGSYIAFLDSDDIYLPKKLEDQVRLLNTKPEAAMLYSSTEYWYSWTGLPEDSSKDWVWDKFGVEANTVVQPPKLLTTFLTDGGTVPCMGSILVRKEAITAVDGWENSFTHIYTDQVFHAKLSYSFPIYVVNGCWDRYRQHPDSSCQIVERTNKAFSARRNYLIWLKNYLSKLGGKKHKELWEAFKNAERPFRYNHIRKVVSFQRKLFNKVKRVFS